MPSIYAHTRMGRRMLPGLDAEAGGCVRSHLHLYELGLCGPDFLYFHDPVTRDWIFDLANKVHHAPGRDFFTPAVRQLRLQPDEGAKAYLYGVLAHFALDSICHPFIHQKADEGVAGHMEMETEFDRWLLERDGCRCPCTRRTADHLTVSAPDAQRIARFYPPMTPKLIQRSFRNYRVLLGLCAADAHSLRRRLIASGLFSDKARQAMMLPAANPRCKTLTPELHARDLQAERCFPELLSQLQALLHRGIPLGEAFDRDFG